MAACALTSPTRTVVFALGIILELFKRQAAWVKEVEDRLIDYLGEPQQQRRVILERALAVLYRDDLISLDFEPFCQLLVGQPPSFTMRPD